MKKILVSLFLTLLFFSGSANPLTVNNKVYAQKPIPPYAKWGKFALQKTHEKYPHAEIIDYLHIGRMIGQQTSTEKFKFWLRHDSKEFGVYINIEFNNQTERVIKVTFEETSR